MDSNSMMFALIGLFIGGGLTVGVLYLRNRLQILDAEKRAKEILEQVTRDSENVKKQRLWTPVKRP